MKTPRLATLLLLSTALAIPGLAHAQDGEVPEPAVEAETDPDLAVDGAAEAADATAEAPVDVSMGGEIVVTGQRDRNLSRTSDQVVSVLSSAEIARTGEGNIAGALGRVTGLTVVGSGFVYVRGLGDRYSLALLNGSPLPSPEPLRRVVPLDIFPTNVVASSVVQKSYSANFPGEFGGGVVNLTTTAVPTESFLNVGLGTGGDTETTGHFGYTYFGASTDWTGFDNGSRDTPPALAAFFASGKVIDDLAIDRQMIAGEMVRFSRAVVQKTPELPVNFSGSLSGGTALDVGSDATLGLIATAGFSNKWSNRQSLQQTASSADLTQIETNYDRVVTDNRMVINGLLGIGLEIGDHKLRLTNLYIRDTIKQARLASGEEVQTGFSRMNQDTAWYERQLIDTQFVGEFRFGDLKVDLRGTYANSQREAPYETSIGYVKTNRASDLFGAYFVNRLNNGQNGHASVAFSELNEDLWYGGIDGSMLLTPRLSASIGYAYTDTARTSSRREFQFIAPSDFNSSVNSLGVAMLRPDLLLAPGIIDFYNIGLVETTQSDPAFAAALTIHGAYGRLNWEPADGVSLDLGVRYETAKQSVNPLQVFAVPSNSGASTLLDNAHWMPSATLTWEVMDRMQLRFNASQTIARPQFREMMFQQYYDPESDRLYRGNPLLDDLVLTNAEARYEWYFASEQRISVAGFWKKIDKPIEAYASFTGNSLETSYANAPRATLYGVEAEVIKNFDLSNWGGFFSSRRIVAMANYTWTKSSIGVAAGDTVPVYLGRVSIQPATNYFVDGSPLTGQSDHLANLQLGLESSDGLSQQTLMLTYASDRVVSRGGAGMPDFVERPGLRLDFVVRQGITLAGQEVEMKFEARNLTARRREEFQQVGPTRIEVNTYDVGQSFSVSASFKF